MLDTNLGSSAIPAAHAETPRPRTLTIQHHELDLKHPDRAELHELMLDEVGWTTSDGW